ncbi:NADH-cytochrome b5 reductase-like [Homarus americanus]|uniref:NADH-cytochrome b5 reductase-like n=1 Tax=Homarus americanus TaxID=6706 RepID=A0A8J5JE49_HOMAM|nr:NADH-cytochrome b5 reductase-like [Homarus americanus]KAG7156642.1 NADH-cytochrome b5 reductase-like [Homarus americanus]
METRELVDIEELLPPKPRAPKPSDCCGSGCCPCVHDIYEQDLKTWKKECELIRNGGREEEPHAISAVQPEKWKEFEIIKINDINNNTYLYTFKLNDDEHLGLNIGHHLIVKQRINGKAVTRQYTPVSAINKRGSFEVLIKIYPTGKITPIIKEWKVGDLIPWRGPFGSFTYKINSYKRILMLAAGTGIAPMYQIIKSILENEDDETFVRLYYASKSFSNILLRDELSNYCQFWNFTMCHYLSGEVDMGQKRYREEAMDRRMAKDDIRQELVKGQVDSTLVLVCGTKSFDKDMVNAAKDANIPNQNIFKF